nr:DEAD/DEAH box helicase [Clostridia bacterium]
MLVVAPLRVARDTWPAEVRKWDHLSEMRISVAVGSEVERRVALTRDADVYVINRENVQWLVEKSGVEWKWDMLVVDELSSFKNPQAKRFKALMKVRGKIKRVVGLTGTPAANGLMDLFAEYRLIDKGVRLGRFITRYREEFFRPDKTNGLVVYSYKPLPFAEEEIYRRIGDITISMKSVDFLPMPEKVMSEVTVYMDGSERKKYEELKKDLVIEGEEITAANAAALCNKLSQLSNGAVYTDDGRTKVFHSRKLDALEDMIEAANGNPVMVVYWFKSDLSRIEERLGEKGIAFERLDDSDSIDRWNRGEIPVLLLSPASAAHGLNLQGGGSHIIWFGLTWSLELYQQTNGRLWRQGQKAKTVVINHIITKNTIDERILAVLKNKDATQEELIAAVKAEV